MFFEIRLYRWKGFSVSVERQGPNIIASYRIGALVQDETPVGRPVACVFVLRRLQEQCLLTPGARS